MSDAFTSADRNISSPAEYAEAVTPGATALTNVTRALYVGTAGNVTVTMRGGGSVTFKNIPAGTVIPVRVSHVTAATAADIIALS